MDALLIIDVTQDRFPSSPPRPLIDLVDRARGVGGVIVHIAAEALDDPQPQSEAQEQSQEQDAAEANTAAKDASFRDVDGKDEDNDDEDREDEADVEDDDEPQLQIDSALGTLEDELVLVSTVPDAFEGIDDLAEGLDDLGVDRIIVAGSNGRGALAQSSFAALSIGFELIVVADGIVDGIADGIVDGDSDGGPKVDSDGDPEDGSEDSSEDSSEDGSEAGDWIADLEAAGAVVKNGSDVWLKM